jgi:DNA-binding CsgD family transcriptional regulator
LGAFHDLETERLAERASHELPSGETTQQSDPSTLTHLTPTELRITQLNSGGLSNREVSEWCWVSPHTVAFHLRSVSRNRRLPGGNWPSSISEAMTRSSRGGKPVNLAGVDLLRSDERGQCLVDVLDWRQPRNCKRELR